MAVPSSSMFNQPDGLTLKMKATTLLFGKISVQDLFKPGHKLMQINVLGY